MSSRRIPLANVPNAANSPYRGSTAASKRSRSQSAAIQAELAYGQPPPAKRQMLVADEPCHRDSGEQDSWQNAEGRVFSKKASGSQLTPFERKLVAAARERHTVQKPVRPETAAKDSLESVRLWQRHYRKLFPQFVFYFESIPEDARAKFSKQIASLGAELQHEEKFFSKAVTHVVTTRPIPPEGDGVGTSNTRTAQSIAQDARERDSESQTINPSLLEKPQENVHSQGPPMPIKGKFTFEASLSRKSKLSNRLEAGPSNPENDLRRRHNGSGDVLYRAREMKMKIWALEKFQRMMTTMFDTDTESQTSHSHNTRSNALAATGNNKANRDAALSQLLRNEKLNGPADRDPTVASKELVHFKGPFIYIHDMDEKTKPVMVREYEKVSNREDGCWPQFRSVSQGRCPFVDEIVRIRRDPTQDLGKEHDEQKKPEKDVRVAPRTRGSAATEHATLQQPAGHAADRALGEIENEAGRPPRIDKCAPHAKLFEPPKVIPAKRGSPERVPRAPHGVQAGIRGARRLYGGEPVASGVQPSNITSAIRSQMISSTAAAPGAKAGTSKEVHELKRKVLEKNSVPSANSIPSSYRMTEATNMAKHDTSISEPRLAKRKANEKLGMKDELGYIEEMSEDEESGRRHVEAKKAKLIRRSKLEKKDPKPGYCENCRDKFDDFDQHTLTRKHRKFATSSENWKELDALLTILCRPRTEEWVDNGSSPHSEEFA
ncbi:MAG: hypothetical protein M1819_001813 [Sarea resinae]|nr:MAG: hypothetical protein M1819_001813 [Sarea resinae]